MKRLTNPTKVTASFNKNELVIICVDVKMFRGSPYSLDQHVEELSTLKALKSKSYPSTTLRLLMMLQEIAQRPYLGIPGYTDDARAFETDTAYRNIVEEYIQRVTNPEGTLLGFRFIFCSVSPKFKWDIGIGNLIAENAKEDKKTPISKQKLKGVDVFTKSILTKDQYISDVIGAWNKDGTANNELLTKMLTLDYGNMGEASLPVAFSYEKACEFFEGASPPPELILVSGNDPEEDANQDNRSTEDEGDGRSVSALSHADNFAPTHDDDASSSSSDTASSSTPEDSSSRGDAADAEEAMEAEDDAGSMAEESTGSGAAPAPAPKPKVKLGPHLYVLRFPEDSGAATAPSPSNDDDGGVSQSQVQVPGQSQGQSQASRHTTTTVKDDVTDILKKENDPCIFFWVSVMTRHPVGMYHTTLYSSALDPDVLTMDFEYLYKTYMQRINQKEEDERIITILDSVKDNISKILAKHDTMSEYDKRCVPDVLMYFESYVQSNELPPGIKAGFEHIKKKQMQAAIKKKKWSAMHARVEFDDIPHFENKDDNEHEEKRKKKQQKMYFMKFNQLSDFASFACEFMAYLEYAMDVDRLHPEIFIAYLASLHAFDVGNKLQLHILDNGTPSSGKSFIQEVVMMLLCAGTFMLLSNITAKGFTSNINLDGMNIFMDETADSIKDKGKSGTGDSIIKSMMMGVDITTLMTSVDHDDHERKSVKTVSKLHVRFHCGENSALSTFADAIADRFYKRMIANWHRQGIEYREAKRSKKNEVLKQAREDFQTKCQDICALACVLAAMMLAGVIPRVDTSYADHLMSKVKTTLAKKGITVPQRRKEHIMAIAESAVIWYALHQVFCTPTYFPDPDTEFEYKHMFHCMPYLYVTDEILYFAVTSASGSLVMSCSKYVYRAIKEKHNKMKELERIERAKEEMKLDQIMDETKTKNKDKTTDVPRMSHAASVYDDEKYYWYPLRACDDSFVLHIAKHTLHLDIESSGNAQFSEENIFYFLLSVMDTTKDDPDDPTQKLTILKTEKRGGIRYLRLLKSYADDETQNTNMDPILETIQELASDKLPEFIIGNTYREYEWDRFNAYHDLIFPQVFRTMKGKNTNMHLRGIHPEYVPTMLRSKRSSSYNTSIPIHTEISSKQEEHFVKYGGKTYNGLVDIIHPDYPHDVIHESYKELCPDNGPSSYTNHGVSSLSTASAHHQVPAQGPTSTLKIATLSEQTKVSSYATFFEDELN